MLKALRNQAASCGTLAGGILARALAPSLPPLERRLARSCDVRRSASARHSAPRESLAPHRVVELRLVEVIGRRRKWRPQRRGARGVVRIARRARRHHAAGGGTVEGAAAAPAMAPATSAVAREDAARGRRRRPRRPHAAQLGAAAHFDGAEQLRRLEVVQPRVGVGRLAARARALQRARDVEVAVVAGACQSTPSRRTPSRGIVLARCRRQAAWPKTHTPARPRILRSACPRRSSQNHSRLSVRHEQKGTLQ